MKTFIGSGRLLALLSIFSFVLALAPNSALAAIDQVRVLDNSFSPQNITINPGDTVVWTNYGAIGHTVIADNGSFVSSSLAPGVNFAYTFNTPGTYGYHDQTYGAVGGAGMAGTVAVGAATQQVVSVASGSSASALQSQAQSLLNQISQLQAQLSASGVSGGVSSGSINASSCPNIGRTLRVGSSGTDVSRLQAYLAQDPSVYPSGQVSGYFGSLTQAAVQRWQAKYAVVSSGSPSTTGFGVVGPRTAAAIALLCSTGSITGSTTTTIPVSTTAAPSVGGVVQVSPISGAAPLTVSVITTVNTVDSCIGAVYVLNFGDGTQSTSIPTQNGNCQPVLQSFNHTYTAAGTYTIVLASGTHQSTAVVTVTGGTATPADSMQASITSGAAPLSVVFTGTVSSPASLNCSGSCSDTINFGDGQIGVVQLPAAGSWQSYVINHTYAAAGSYTAQLESVTGAADGAPITITASTPANQVGGSYGIASVNASPVTNGGVAASATVALPACGSYEINWGDGSSLTTGTGACAAGGSTATINHTYTIDGSFTITLEDGNGNPKATTSVSVAGI